MDLFLQGVGFCSVCLLGSKFAKTFSPYLFKKNLSLLKTKYNSNGNKFALITGSSDGVGKEFARVLAQQNINIILHGRNIEKLNSVKQEILQDPLTGKGVQVEIFEQNLSENSLNIEKQAANILSKYKISLLINNAGITSVEAIKNSNVEDIQTIVNTNAMSPIVLSKYVLQNHFTNKDEEYGIINISSLTADLPIGFLSVYSASKSFLHTFSNSLSKETSSNIQVTSMKPYYISTKMTRFQKLSFTTISPLDFVNGSLNSLLHKQNTSCGNWKHQIIHSCFSVVPTNYLSNKLTSNMETVANQLYKIKLIEEKRNRAKQQKLQQQSSQQQQKQNQE